MSDIANTLRQAKSNFDKVQNGIKEGGTYLQGIRGLYDLRKSKSIDDFNKVYEAAKLAIEKIPLGKALMKYYDTGFKLLFDAIKSADEVNSVSSALEAARKTLTDFYNNSGRVIQFTSFNGAEMSEGPFYYLGKLQKNNPTVQFEDLTKHVQAVIAVANLYIKFLDSNLRFYIPISDNFKKLGKVTDKELSEIIENKKSIFSMAFASIRLSTNVLNLVGDDELIIGVNGSIDSLLKNRSNWGTWLGDKGKVTDKNHYYN